MPVILIFLFILGLIVGSFYNVVALRLCKNESLIYPGSHCVNCNHALAWYELIPVFSYLFLHGKCRKCKIHISWQYPLVELATGTLFSLSFYLYGFTLNTLISIIVCSIVIIIFITDIKYMIILDEVLFTGIILLCIVYYFYGGVWCILNHLLRGGVLFLILLLIKLLGDRAFNQESLGWGDVKLSFIAGMILGARLGVIYLFLGAFIAFPYACYQSIKKKNAILPFGPFLAISLLIIFWNNNAIIELLNAWIGGPY